MSSAIKAACAMVIVVTLVAYCKPHSTRCFMGDQRACDLVYQVKQ